MHSSSWLSNLRNWFGKNKMMGILSIMLSVIILSVICALLFIDTILKPVLSKKLETAIVMATDSLYHIDFKVAELNVLQGNAILTNVSLTPDTVVYNKMKRLGTAPGEVYKVQLKQLVIKNAHPFKMYFHKQLNIGQLDLTSPKIVIARYFAKADTVNKKSTTLYQKLSKTFKYIQVGAINLNHVGIIQNNYLGSKLAVSTLKDLDVKAIDLLIDSSTQTDKSRTLFCKDIGADLSHFELNTADGLYQFKVQRIHFSTKTSVLSVIKGEMIPIPSAQFFAKNTMLDQYTLRLDTIIARGFDLNEYYKHQSYTISKLLIKNGYFEIYPNPRSKRKPGNRFVTYPNYVLRHLKNGLNVDTAEFKNIKIVYSQFNAASGHTGSVSFNNTTGRFLNITNSKKLIAKNNISSVNLTTYLMGTGKLNLSVQFNLISPAYNFSYQGHLGLQICALVT